MQGKRAAESATKLQLWQERLNEWKGSQLTQIEYCRRNNLDIRNFVYWKRRISPKPFPAALVELPADVLSRSLATGTPLCLVLGARYRIEIAAGFDADTLQRLIGVLSRP